jgi:hypothetical protein
VFSWSGNVKITPEKDTWIDTKVNTNVVNVTGTTSTQTVSVYQRMWGLFSNGNHD